MGLLTGHCPLKYYLKKMGKAVQYTCRFCELLFNIFLLLCEQTLEEENHLDKLTTIYVVDLISDQQQVIFNYILIRYSFI